MYGSSVKKYIAQTKAGIMYTNHVIKKTSLHFKTYYWHVNIHARLTATQKQIVILN